MNVKVMGYEGEAIEFEDVDAVRWSVNEVMSPYADPGERVLYLAPGTEFLIDSRDPSSREPGRGQA